MIDYVNDYTNDCVNSQINDGLSGNGSHIHNVSDLDSASGLDRGSDRSESRPESGPEAAGEPTTNNLRDLPLRVPSLTNSPGCVPGRNPNGALNRSAAPLRAMRAVRVDAWATPAATSWTRTRKTIRKINRQSQSTSWALPF